MHNEHVVCWLRYQASLVEDTDQEGRLLFKSYQEEDLQAGLPLTLTYEQFIVQPTFGDDDFDATWMEE